MNENQTEDISYRVAKHHSLRENKGGGVGGGIDQSKGAYLLRVFM